MIDASRLTITAIDAQGVESRWAGDEREARNVFSGLTITTAVPGGYKTMRCALPREIIGDDFDLNPLDLVIVEGPGGEVVFEGRQAELPRQSGDESEVEVNAVGRSSELLYDPTFREVYVDRSFEAWGEPSEARMAVQKALSIPVGTDHVVQIRTRALHFEGPTRKEVEGGSTVEAWYRCPPGRKAKRLEFSVAQGWVGSLEGPTVFNTDDDTALGAGQALAVGSNQVEDLTTPTRYLALRFRANSTYTQVAGFPPYRTFSKLGVYGDNGVPLRAVDGDLFGVLASDVVRDVIARAAPLLTFTDESIPATDFVIPHLVFPDPVSAEDVLLAVNAYHLYDWGVYEGEVFFRPITDYRRRWGLRAEAGGAIDDAGPQAESVVNGIVVSFTDENGEQRLVGPPGSGCDYEDAALAVSNPANAVNAHGIPAKYERLDVSVRTTLLGAIQLGIRRLAELALSPYRGSFVAAGEVIDLDSQITYPSWAARAGDSLTLLSADTDEPIGDEHRIVETSFDYDSLDNTLSVDDAPFRLDAMIARLEAVTR